MLLLKLFRDLSQNRIQFLSIFLMSFLGIYVFVGMDSEVTGLEACEESYYEETNLADLWATGREFSKEDVNAVKHINSVADAQRRIMTEGKAELDSDEYGDEPTMQMIFLEDEGISNLKISEGIPYRPGSSGVWIDQAFASRRRLRIGDQVTFKLENTKFTEKISGFFYHPEYVYYVENLAAMMPAYGRYGVAVFDISEYPLEDIEFNSMVLDAHGIDNKGVMTDEEKAAGRALASKIKNVLDDEEMVVFDKTELMSYSTFRSEMEQHHSMSFAFPIVFVLISLLGIVTTMSRLLARQRVQIGTMKALGFSTGRIILHYVSYGFFLSLTGSIAGALVGYHTLPAYIISMFTETYILPVMKTGFSSLAFLMIVMEVAVSSFIAWYASRRECALIPAEALRPASPKNVKATALEKSALWDKLSFSARWNLRDIMRNKVRSLMGTAGVIGCAMLMFSAFGCLDSLNFITGWMYGEINTAKTKITMEEGTPYGTTMDWAKKYSGQMIENEAITLKAGDIVKTGTLTVLDTGNFMHFEDADRHSISLDKKGVAMSYKMAEMLNVKEGDFFTWNLQGDKKKYKMRVGKIYRNPSSQGLTMYRKTYEDLDIRSQTTEILTNVTVPDSAKDRDEIADVQNTDEMMDSMDAMMEMMYTMAAILITAAIVLAVVVLYNLGVLSLIEKRREMATLKVLGLKTNTIRAILQEQNVWLTIFGVGSGYIAGFGILGVMFGDMPEAMDYCIVVEPKSYLLTFLGTLVLSMLVNQVLSREVKNIDMVEALKGIE